MADKVTLTVNTNPSDARVRFYIEGAVVQSGETFSVPRGTSVHYVVQKAGYITVENTITVTENTLLNVYLKEIQTIYHTIKIIATPSTATITFVVAGQANISGTGSKSITVAEGTTVSYTVSNTGYTTVTGSVVAVDNLQYKVGLHQNDSTINFNVKVNPIPEDAKVLLQDKGSNVIVNGSPSINFDLIASNFSRNDYLSCVVNNDSLGTINSCEIVFRILTPITPTTSGRIFNVCGAGSGEAGGGPYVEYYHDGTDATNKGICRLVWYDIDSGSYITCNASTDQLEKNTWYYCKWVYDRSEKTIQGSFSKNNKDWFKGEKVELSNLELAKIIFSTNTYFLGVRQSGSRPANTVFNGSIDLSQSYIKINDAIKWHSVVASEHLYNHSATASSVTGHYIVIGNNSWGYNDYKHDSFSVKGDMTIPVSLNLVSGVTLFESSTPGNYQVIIRESKYYDIVLVGAGGGGAGEWFTYTNTWTTVHRFLGIITHREHHSINYASAAAAGGGSGSNYRGTIYLTKGTYTVTVGEGGLSAYKSLSTDYVEGKVGGNSMLSGRFNGSDQAHYIAFGGKPGVCQLSNDCNVKTLYSQEANAVYEVYKRYTGLLARLTGNAYRWVELSGGLTPTKGNKGSTSSTGKLQNKINADIEAAGGLSTYQGYGVGGKGSSLVTYKAGNGYVKLTVH